MSFHQPEVFLVAELAVCASFGTMITAKAAVLDSYAAIKEKLLKFYRLSFTAIREFSMEFLQGVWTASSVFR